MLYYFMVVFMVNNYDQILIEEIARNEEKGLIPTILLHSCCAPCSSYVIEYLSQYFYITILYYNPNISPKEEYDKRKEEQVRFIKSMPTCYPVRIIDCDYDHEIYVEKIRGLENEPERGRRCDVCFRLRLEKTAKEAQIKHFDYFGTTLTVSPYKNAKLINEIGKELESIYKVSFLPADFKKRNGYKRSIELSHKYQLYRQNYCGCQYSKKTK